MSIYAGIDAGTQSIKVLVYDALRHEVVALVSAGLDLVAHDDGTREQNARDWIRALQMCFSGIDAELRRQIKAIAVSGQQHGFVPVAANGEVLAPVKLWCDTATTQEVHELTQTLGGESACIALTGNPIMPGYTASKLLWTKRHRPQAYAQLTSILLPHDYLNFYLTGAHYSEFGDASGTGWFDVRSRRYSDTVLKAVDQERDLQSCLPKLINADALTPILPNIAALLGLSEAVQVGAGGGDNMMAAIGTACVVPGKLSMSLGTSGTLFCHSDHALVSPEGKWAAFCSSSGGWLPLICTMNCTVATETCARLFGLTASDADDFMFASLPGASGISMLPFFNGERTPNLPLARGALYGLDVSNTSPKNIYRASMEGASFSLRQGYDFFAAAGLTFDSITLTGGGSRSHAWRQMIADVFNLPVQVPAQTEGAAFGAALQAMWAHARHSQSKLSLSSCVAEHVRMNAALSTKPNPKALAAYEQAYQRFLSYLSQLSGTTAQVKT
jgi:xylulokinase